MKTILNSFKNYAVFTVLLTSVLGFSVSDVKAQSSTEGLVIINEQANKALTVEFTTSSGPYSLVLNGVAKVGADYELQGELDGPGSIFTVQQWNLVSLGNEVVQILNKDTGMAVDVINGQPAQNKADKGDRGQQWKTTSVGSLTRLVNVSTGKALSLTGNSVGLSNVSSSESQLWKVTDYQRFLGGPIGMANPVRGVASVSITAPSVFEGIDGKIIANKYENGVFTSTVLAENISVPANSEKEIDLNFSSLPAGNYILVLVTENKGRFATQLLVL